MNVSKNNVYFLDFEDGMLASYNEADVREKLVINVRTIQPHIVITFYPYPDWYAPANGGKVEGYDDMGYHPDHQATGKLVLDTVYGPSAGDPRIFVELYETGNSNLQPWHIEQLYFWRFGSNAKLDYCVSFDQTYLNNKLQALYLHQTQWANKTYLQANLEWVGKTMDGYCNNSDNKEEKGKESGTKFAEAYQAYF